MPTFQLPNWPSFQPGEHPEGLPPQLVALLNPLHQMAAATLVLRALGQDAAFGKKVDGTLVAAGVNTINVCLLDSIILSLCALYDESGDAIRLRTILNRLADPRNAPSLKLIMSRCERDETPHAAATVAANATTTAASTTEQLASTNSRFAKSGNRSL